jgi:hypothetical protein
MVLTKFLLEFFEFGPFAGRFFLPHFLKLRGATLQEIGQINPMLVIQLDSGSERLTAS